MGENAQRDVAGMFDNLVMAPQTTASPRLGPSGAPPLVRRPTGVNGTYGRVAVPEVQIGFFLHTPFPSSEVFRLVLSASSLLYRSLIVECRVLPVRREILLGILNCDLIGFHTYDYARHFLSSCTRLLGLKCLPNSAYAHSFVDGKTDSSFRRCRIGWSTCDGRNVPYRYRSYAVP